MYTLFIGAIFIGLSLGVMGSGGAILTIPVLIYGFDQPEKLAILNSLAIVAIIALVTSARNLKSQQIRWPLVFHFGIAGMLGTYLGAMLGNAISGQAQLLIFIATLFISAIKMFRSSIKENQGDCEANLPTWVLPVSGFAVGVLTGLIGVGGGFLIVPALILIAKLSLQHAVATSLVIIFMNSVLGFAKYFDSGGYAFHSFDWWPIIIVSTIGIVSSFLGQKWAENVPQKRLKQGFSAVLLLVGLYIGGQLYAV